MTVDNPTTKDIKPAGEAGGVLASDDASLAALIATGHAEVVKSAPPKGSALGRFYILESESKYTAIYLGQGAGNEPLLVADLSGTPADGSVTLVKIAAEALAAIAKPWRSRQMTGGQLTASAAAATKYFILPGGANEKEPGIASAEAAYPWRVGWVAADEAIQGLATKCKIKAEGLVKTAAKVTLHIALYKVTKGEKLTLGEEVAGSGKDIELGEGVTNTGVAGESAEFTIPEDGDYTLGATVSGTPAAGIDIQARLLVHNV